jgi:hypothetical protein
VKTLSLSLTMEHRKPWSRTMLSKNTRATDCAEYGWLKDTK